MGGPAGAVHCPCRHGELRHGSGKRAVFLDRDGVLIPDTGYPDDPAAIVLNPGVPGALAALRDAGYRLVVVTNQSGVARGCFTLERLAAVHQRLRELLARGGAVLDALYFCPHLPGAPVAAFAGDCPCRKPRPGMLLAAAQELGLDLRECWMVGDGARDVAAATAAGCRAVRIGAADETGAPVAPDLSHAVRIIVAAGNAAAARSGVGRAPLPET